MSHLICMAGLTEHCIGWCGFGVVGRRCHCVLHGLVWDEHIQCSILSAPGVARFFVACIMLHHEAPRVVVSDRGTSFVSVLVTNVRHLCATVYRTSTAYHSQTNGIVERFNHTLAGMSLYVTSDHSNWDVVLPFVTFAYNSLVQQATGCSPFRLSTIDNHQ